MIEIQAGTLEGFRPKDGPLAIFLLEGDGLALHPSLKKHAPQILALARGENLRGRAGQVASVTLGNQKLLLAGIGKKDHVDQEALRRTCAQVARYAQSRYTTLGVGLPVPPSKRLSTVDLAMAAAEGLALGTYRYTKYKKISKEEEPILQKAVLLGSSRDQAALHKAVHKAGIRVDSVAFVRDLVNQGPSDKKPETLASLARSIAKGPIRAKIFTKKDLQAMGMNAILGVARGSPVEPCFVHLTYKPRGRARKRIALVGKGITFDSGGLSLKSPQHMETMKMDMAGAAAVLGVFKALPVFKPQVEVQGFMPFTYNLPGGDALKPGDILRAYNGKTIEVLNTDAEGRLILCDALAYASKMKFDAIIDLATLTGSALVALGSKVTGAMTNNKGLWEDLQRAGQRAGESLWELPLVSEYKDSLRSKVADLQNISSIRGEAGTIIGGLFLQEFVDTAPWIHLDIAGTAWSNGTSAYQSPGGTGAMVRTLIEYLESL